MTDDENNNKPSAASKSSEDVDKAVYVAARSRRNLWIGLGLLGFVVLVGLLTALRIAENGLGPGQEIYYHLDTHGQ